jgi:hypothetical protein
MLDNIDVLSFLRNGKMLLYVFLEQPVDTLFATLGTPTLTYGDKHAGFHEYGPCVRFGYIKNYIDEIAFIFYARRGAFFPVGTIDGKEKAITNKTRIHEFIRILNHAGIQWHATDEKNVNVFCVRTIGNVVVLFDLETGYIISMNSSA